MIRSVTFSSDPRVQGGQWVVAGTRMPAKCLLEYVQEGRAEAEQEYREAYGDDVVNFILELLYDPLDPRVREM